MSDEDNLSPKDGFEAIMKILPDIAMKTDNSDLAGIIGLVDQIGDIGIAAGMDPQHIEASFAGVKDQSARLQAYFANMDAALWAGDLVRANMLQDNMPGLDGAALGIETNFDVEEDDIEFEITLEDLGLDLSEHPEEIIPDRYAEIAAGKPGAIAAFIATRQDPNVPTGDDQHTAFLAALDAPARNASDLKALIDAGADPLVRHALGDTALSWALGYHHFDTVTADGERAVFKLLVEAGIDINHDLPDFGSPFRRALIQATANQVAALLEFGADASADLPMEFSNEFLAGASPLIEAAPKPAMLKFLLDHGLDSREVDSAGQHPVEFVKEQAAAARDRVDEDDPWTLVHADALDASHALLMSSV